MEPKVEGLEVMFDLQMMRDGKMHSKNVVFTNPPDLGHAVSGIVKSYNPVKGFGFFSVEGLDADVFFSKERIPEAYNQLKLENTKAIFQMQLKRDGKYEAISIQLADVEEVPNQVHILPGGHIISGGEQMVGVKRRRVSATGNIIDINDPQVEEA